MDMPLKKTIQEIGEVAAVNSATLAMTYTNLEAGLKLLLLLISIIFTLDKWYSHRKRNKKNK
tara:strand:- start:686 stop:871 length:186 start_codon:yes stop_codon:yes gene_type:complete